MIGITGHGGYVPLYRVDRSAVASQQGANAPNETAVPARDENHVTMASEAADIALRRAGIDTSNLTGVFSASVTDRFAEHGLAAHVAYRIGATGDVRTADCRASRRASTDALLSAIDHVTARGTSALVVAADIVPAEPGHDEVATAGAGAGALVVEAEPTAPVAEVERQGSATTGFVERHRRHGEPAVSGDQKFEGLRGQETMTTAVSRAAGEGDEEAVDSGVVSVATERWARGVLDEGVKRHSTYEDVGDAGVAAFYLDLAHLLEMSSGGERTLAVACGAGGADALLLSVGESIPDEGLSVEQQVQSKEFVTYAKHLEYREAVDYQGVQMG